MLGSPCHLRGTIHNLLTWISCNCASIVIVIKEIKFIQIHTKTFFLADCPDAHWLIKVFVAWWPPVLKNSSKEILCLFFLLCLLTLSFKLQKILHKCSKGITNRPRYLCCVTSALYKADFHKALVTCWCKFYKANTSIIVKVSNIKGQQLVLHWLSVYKH